MFKKIKQSAIVLATLVVTLLIFTSCDNKNSKSKTQNSKSKTSISNTASKPKTQNPKPKINLAINPSFEIGRNNPYGWKSHNQHLHTQGAWTTTEAHTGKNSMMIENIAATNAYLQGKPITFKEPANSFDVSLWTKTKDISKSAKFYIRLVVTLKPSSKTQNPKLKTINIDLKASKNWTEITKTALFTDNIEKVTPYLYLADGTGTAYFDNFSINPELIDFSKGKLVFDSNNKNSTFNIKPVNATQNLKLKTQNTILYQVKGQKTIISSNFIPIKEGTIYTLSGEFKAVSVEPSRLYFGYAPYTKNKKFISKVSVNYINGTETELVRSCKPTDKVLYVKNAENWLVNKYECVAFDIDSTGKFTDLPNNNLSSIGIEQIINEKDFYKIILKKSCGKTFPLGTKVREHVAGSSYIYNVSSNVLLKNNWNSFSNLITTKNQNLMVSKFYPQTKYVKIIILANINAPKAKLQFEKIKLEKIIKK